MGRVAGKVVFITGAARGQGRAHAVRLAEEGADIIAVDVGGPVGGIKYALGTEEDLAETVRLVEATGRRILARKVDVRDFEALKAVADEGAKAFGKIDSVVGNAGVSYIAEWSDDTEDMWNDCISVNLTGAWNTVRATAPHLIEAGGGSIVLTASSSAVNGMPFMAPYVSSKAGVLGLVHALAYELSEHNVRINALLPGGVNTPMGGSAGGAETLLPLIDKYPRTRGVFNNILPNTITEPEDQAAGALYLLSDEARYVTSTEFSVDSGVMRS